MTDIVKMIYFREKCFGIKELGVSCVNTRQHFGYVIKTFLFLAIFSALNWERHMTILSKLQKPHEPMKAHFES